MKSIWIASCTALSGLLLLATVTVQADTLATPLGQQTGQASAQLPQRGLTSTRVQQRYGEPARRHPAVGTPPISRWDYADFSVYFEHDKVLHSVRQHRPQGNGYL